MPDLAPSKAYDRLKQPTHLISMGRVRGPYAVKVIDGIAFKRCNGPLHRDLPEEEKLLLLEHFDPRERSETQKQYYQSWCRQCRVVDNRNRFGHKGFLFVYEVRPFARELIERCDGKVTWAGKRAGIHYTNLERIVNEESSNRHRYIRKDTAQKIMQAVLELRQEQRLAA